MGARENAIAAAAAAYGEGGYGHAHRMNKAIAAYEAALSAAGLSIEQGWQPESTAPIDNQVPILLRHRDGRTIIPDCFTVGRVPENPPGQRFVGCWLHRGTIHARDEFTAWRPLPAAPTQEASDDRG